MNLKAFMANVIAFKSNVGDVEDVSNNPLNCTVNGPNLLFRSILYDREIKYTDYRNAHSAALKGKKGINSNDDIKFKWSLLINGLSSDSISWSRFKNALVPLNVRKGGYEIVLTWSDRFEYSSTPPEKVTYQTIGNGNELKRLFENLVNTMELTPEELSFMVTTYIRNRETNSVADESTTRSNINRELLSGCKFTWGVFCKMLTILGVSSFRLNMVINWAGGSMSNVYSIEQDLIYSDLKVNSLPPARIPGTLITC